MEGPISLRSIQLSASLEDVARLGVVLFKGLRIGEGSPALTDAIEGLSEEIRGSLAGRQPSSLTVVERTRRLYHQVGLDPTKHRPSSERLLRRVIRGKPVLRVNDFADAMSLVSLKLQFPLGFYDWDALVPPLLARIGRPLERFEGQNGDLIALGGKIVLVDGEGPFGNPTHDSSRAMVTGRTVRAVVILYAPADTPRAELEEGLHEVVRAGGEFCGGQCVLSGIVP